MTNFSFHILRKLIKKQIICFVWFIQETFCQNNRVTFRNTYFLSLLQINLILYFYFFGFILLPETALLLNIFNPLSGYPISVPHGILYINSRIFLNVTKNNILEVPRPLERINFMEWNALMNVLFFLSSRFCFSYPVDNYKQNGIWKYSLGLDVILHH